MFQSRVYSVMVLPPVIHSLEFNSWLMALDHKNILSIFTDNHWLTSLLDNVFLMFS